MSSLSVYRVLAAVLLVWAVISTVFLGYYFNLYVDVERSKASLSSRISEFQGVLDNLKNELRNLSNQLELYNRSYMDTISRLKSLLERSVAILVIDYGNGTIEHHKVYFVEGVNNTVFNLTISVAVVNYTYYASYGDYFINGINGVYNRNVNSTSGYYWMFYVNFRLSDKGAFQTKVYDGDVIIWNYTYVSWG